MFERFNENVRRALFSARYEASRAASHQISTQHVLLGMLREELEMLESHAIGSFIFLGPSGVGKTEVARQLATFLFQDVRHLLRFDISEYMEKHTVSRLIGSPPGYVGFEEGGQLSEQVRRNPYSVILLDEMVENLSRRHVVLEYDPEVPTWLLDQCGLDPQAGARPLRRLIKLWVEDAIADVLIDNPTAGEIRLRVRMGDGRPEVVVIPSLAHSQEVS